MARAVETKEDALSILRAVLYGAQKARSITAENGYDAIGEEYLATLNPWLYGKGNIVPKLAEAIGRYEKPGVVIPGSELFNFLYIACKAEPSIIVCAGLAESHKWRDIEPDYRWMTQEFA
jgi:hypothetical protein